MSDASACDPVIPGSSPPTRFRASSVETQADPTFEDVFGHLYPSEAAVNQFVDAMDSFAALSAPPVLGAFDLSGFRTMGPWLCGCVVVWLCVCGCVC